MDVSLSAGLAGTYYAKTDHAADDEAASDPLSVLEAKATFDGRQLELSNRFAMRDGVIYIDMADTNWRVVKVSPLGWRSWTSRSNCRRYSHPSGSAS